MADEAATTPDNTQTPQTHDSNSPSQGSSLKPAATTNEATKQPTNNAVPKPHAPSPAAFAKQQGASPAAPSLTAVSYADDAITQAQSFGRVDEQGNVFVTDNGADRKVGEFPDAQPQEALHLYATRYLELKSKLDLFETRLKTAAVKAHEIDESLKTLEAETKEPQVVGNLDALRQQFATLKSEAEHKKQAIAEERKKAQTTAIAERTVIVEKAEKLAASLGDSTNWRSTADKFRSLFDEWQNHQRNSVRIDKQDADALWKRFSSARTSFNQGRRKWAQTRDAEHAKAKEAKQAIIAEAEAIKNSTDWGETSRSFNALMDRWKQAGRAGRHEDDDLWAQFRAAADTFFNARQNDRDQTSSDEKANLVKKEALIVKAEALLPVKDERAAKQARQQLAQIQEAWDQIGYVPREDVHRIESRLDAVDKQIKSVEDAVWKKSDPEADARKSSFTDQLRAQLKEIDDQIAATSDAKKIKALQAEKATKEQWLNAVR